MKKVLAFFAFALFLAACSSVGKFKPMVEELASKWDSATGAVTSFAGEVTTEQQNWLSAKSSWAMPSPEAMAKWDDATKAKYNEAQTAVANTESSLSAMSGEVSAFATGWQEKGKELQALKDGIAAGKLEGNPQETINSLNTAVTDASTKLEGWKKSLADWKAAAANSQKMMADFIASQPAPKSSTK
ncbi:MAG: hypothetical protein AAB316_16395 [Bacteroidota bacterium]